MMIGSSPRLWGTPTKRKAAGADQRFIPTPVGNTAGWTWGQSGSAVHPHACGEHLADHLHGRRHVGSSPRLWGTPLRAAELRVFHRFIPTPVGNTRPVRRRHPGQTVHPHACGEHTSSAKGISALTGSSPRLWGTRLCHRGISVCTRFIPTPVGNTFDSAELVTLGTVHPHACGEHSSFINVGRISAGSSPRLWGTPTSARTLTARIRFIPTPVGNTCRRPLPGRTKTVHPHACGEHILATARGAMTTGSSPRLWGTRDIIAATATHGGFIPTPVGNTVYAVFSLFHSPVHPHACGEHLLLAFDEILPGGSSPRLWGTPDEVRGVMDRLRFIPTPVGNTHCCNRRNRSRPVHPHACGEHRPVVRSNCKLYGSSPRLWGTPLFA